MTISLKHAKESLVADEGNTDLVQPSDWNDEHTLTQATDRILGRVTAGAGATEELTAAQVRTLLNVADGATADQDLSAYQLQPSEGAFVDGDKTKLDGIEAGAAASPLTTKGDIYSYSAGNARLAVGANGQVLSADSSTATGLKWIALAGGGDMAASTYDPNAVGSDAFDMDNMVEGTDTKILTAAERAAIAANTSARHDAVTVSDSSEIDLTLTGQQISASIVAGSIDESKLDASVNASLDLADSALQAADIGVSVQAYDAQLDTWSGVTPSANGQSLVSAADYAAMRGLLDLEAGTDFYSISAADAAFQPLATVLTNTTASFTTALETKLNNIEASADVTDTANVTAAGALMDSEITSLVSVKAINQGLSTSDSPQFAGVNVGHASDTTITRSAAGVIAVEGVPLFAGIPQNSQSAAYTLVLADAQKHILHPSADTTARTWTIPANASVAFPIGTVVTFINQNSAGVITIAITTDTMRLAGAGTTGSRTLAANGMATAVKITSTEWIISGNGLT